MKIALLTEIPAPFRIPLFDALAAQPGVELRVLFLAADDPRRNYPRLEQWFASEVLPGRDFSARGRWTVVNAGVLGRLRRFRPDVVPVGGWNQPAFWQAAAWARAARRPLVVWVESTGRDERSRSSWRSARCSGPRPASSSRARRQPSTSWLGARPKQIVVAPNAPDPSLFEGAPPRDEARAELGVDGCVFLCVSRLSPEKGVDVLVRAFDGVSGETLKAAAAALNELPCSIARTSASRPASPSLALRCRCIRALL